MNSVKFGMILSILAAMTTGCMAEEVSPAEVAGEEQVGAENQALIGGDACKNVSITITNSFEDGSRPAAIKVDRVKYFSASEGDWLEEELNDAIISYGGSFLWPSEDLARAENDTITMWRVYFRYEIGGAWSSMINHTDNTPDDVCHAYDHYSITVN